MDTNSRYRRMQDHRWMILAVASLALGVLLILVEIIPRSVDAYKEFRAWQDTRTRIKAANAWEVELATANLEARQLQAKLDTLHASPVGKDEVSGVLHALQQNTESLDVRVIEIQPGERMVHETYETLPLDVTLQGSFQDIGVYLSRLERARQLLHVSAINLQPERPLSSSLEANIRLQVLIVGGTS